MTAKNRHAEPEQIRGPIDLWNEIAAYEDGRLDQEATVDLFQYLVDTGLAWEIEEHYGRTAEELIREGLITR